MHHRSNSPALSTFALLLAGDWPQWRGPDGDGVSRETEWVSEGAAENPWEAQVGLGYSSVAVADGRAYTLGHGVSAGLDILWCFDAETGEVLWTHEWPAKVWKEMHSGGTLTTPAIAGGAVFVTNREGRFFRLDAESGEVDLERDLAQEFEVEPPKWGFGVSPLVLDEGVVLNLGKVFLLDSKGERLFFQEWETRYDINAATPVVAGERLFISSGLGRGAGLVGFEGDEAKLLWENKGLATKMSGCVLMNDALFGFDESVLKCMDLEGKERWHVRGLGDGCVIGAGERLLVMSADGELIVAEATPEEFRDLARKKVLEGGKYWTTPTLANGLIYCRNSAGHLVCGDHRAR